MLSKGQTIFYKLFQTYLRTVRICLVNVHKILFYFRIFWVICLHNQNLILTNVYSRKYVIVAFIINFLKGKPLYWWYIYGVSSICFNEWKKMLNFHWKLHIKLFIYSHLYLIIILYMDILYIIYSTMKKHISPNKSLLSWLFKHLNCIHLGKK